MSSAAAGAGGSGEGVDVDMAESLKKFHGLGLSMKNTSSGLKGLNVEKLLDIAKETIELRSMIALRKNKDESTLAKEDGHDIAGNGRKNAENNVACVDDLTNEESFMVFGPRSLAKQFDRYIQIKDPETGEIAKHRVIDWGSMSSQEVYEYKQDIGRFRKLHAEMNKERFVIRQQSTQPRANLSFDSHNEFLPPPKMAKPREELDWKVRTSAQAERGPAAR